jgi:O-antigen chain-terminating methyltransferase
MLGVLRFSEEGRKANVAVAGLRTALVLRRLRKVPIIGRLVGIAQYVVQLPLIVRNLELLDATAHRHNWKLQVGLHGVREELRVLDRLEELEAAAARVNAAAMRERIAAIQKSEMALRAWVGAFAEHLLDLRRQATELGRRVDLDASRAEMLAISSRMLEGVMALQERQSEITREQDKASQANERLDQLVSDWAANQDALELMKVNMRSLTVRKATAAVPDSFYADFEDAFRGKREDIKSRVAVYLPLVKAASKATGTAPVLDVGCGRGEWLELLTDSGIPATGIDSNIAMAQRCRDLKLDVMEGDGVAHLRSLESASLTAVTAIHIIEHLPFGDLLSLFAEAFRVLRPGGVIIFETPNPENVLVGACNFWFDPTHVKPLPPEMMRYVAREKGFDRVEILPLHPYSEAERLPEYADEGLQRRINHLFYGPQDYAVVGYKP